MLQADGKNCKAERFVVLEQLLGYGGRLCVGRLSLSFLLHRKDGARELSFAQED